MTASEYSLSLVGMNSLWGILVPHAPTLKKQASQTQMKPLLEDLYFRYLDRRPNQCSQASSKTPTLIERRVASKSLPEETALRDFLTLFPWQYCTLGTLHSLLSRMEPHSPSCKVITRKVPKSPFPPGIKAPRVPYPRKT